jgi:polyisoprenoid-binding protein YceI
MRTLALIATCFVLACPAGAVSQDFGDPPAGVYRVDPTHANLLAFVDHLGMSDYLIRFTRFDAELVFNPEHPDSMSVSAQIDVSSLRTGYPREDVDFDATITGPDWLDAGTHPYIIFTSTAVYQTGANTADVTGQLSLLGVEREVVLAVTYNGGYAGMPVYDPQGRIGFSATTTFNRSDFGLVNGLPTPDFNIGVGDPVEVRIELEMLGPPLPDAGEAP